MRAEFPLFAGMASFHRKGSGEGRLTALVVATARDVSEFRALAMAYLGEQGWERIALRQEGPVTQAMQDDPAFSELAGLAARLETGFAIVHGTVTETTQTPGDTDPALVIEELLLPDTAGPWISPELHAQLFGPDRDGAALNTYLVVDPTRRRDVSGLFDLDVLDLPLRCLFTGSAREQMSQVAPYLLDLTLTGFDPDSDTAPRFHRDFFARHWGHNTGIFLRSAASFDDVWRHCRKFTRVRREGGGGWMFFRFWDPLIALPYFPTMRRNPDRVIAWFGGQIEIARIVLEGPHGRRAHSFSPHEDLNLSSTRVLTPLVLTHEELAPFNAKKLEADILKICQNLRRDFGEDLAHLTDDLLLDRVRTGIAQMRAYGFRRHEYLYTMAAWIAFFGPGFHARDPDKRLAQICETDLPEAEKFRLFETRLFELSDELD